MTTRVLRPRGYEDLLLLNRQKNIMDREILFRAVSENTRHWVYGQLYEGPVKDAYGSERIKWQITSVGRNGYRSEVVDPKTIGQYTGLRDVQGQKIFEGDKIWLHTATGTHFGIVVWCNHSWKVDAEGEDGILTFSESVSFSKNGNIHDGPEMQKGGEQ